MNRFFSVIFSGAFVGLGIYFTACKSTKPSSTTAAATKPVSTCTTVPTYSADIKAIMDASCASTCHSANHKADGIDLSSYELLKTEAVKRHFMGSIKQESGFAAMPKKAAKLDDITIKKIACWIENGMPQ